MIDYMKLLQQTHNIWLKGDHENIKFIRYILDELQNLWCIYIDDARYADAAFEDAFWILLFDVQECEEVNEQMQTKHCTKTSVYGIIIIENELRIKRRI